MLPGLQRLVWNILMLTLDAHESAISFGSVKAVLASLGLGPVSDDPRVDRSLRLLYPLDTDLARRVRSGATSLTDSATSSEQIRFSQGHRAERSLIAIARWVTAQRGAPTLTIGSASALDAPSREFFRLASSTAGWIVTLIDGSAGGSSEDVAPEVVTAEEKALLDALSCVDDDACRHHVWQAAFDYVNSGDAWTSRELGSRLMAVEDSARVWNLMALSCAMLGRTVEAEYFYDKWIATGDRLDRVRALYGKSMLYARHHPAGLRDLDVSGSLLETAHRIIDELPPETRHEDMTVFESVFNRNGFALVEFRRGHVDRAIELLRSGISRLGSTAEKVAIHRSVLIYNLAQCFVRLGRARPAMDTFAHLLEVDPHMPEYWLEAAKCVAANGRLAAAVDHCRHACDLDPHLPVAWSLLGTYLCDSGEFTAAVDAYTEASGLEPEAVRHVMDAAYCLLLSGHPRDARARLDGVATDRLSEREFTRHSSLLAEAFLGSGDRDSAATALERAVERYPASRALRSNLAVVLS